MDGIAEQGKPSKKRDASSPRTQPHGKACSPKLVVFAYPRTMVTGQWACRTTASETLPSKVLLSLP